ncbi:MAG: DUF1573 domain-containing protein [Rikenellaceae bacterium]|nr:DUF1573 domain-containing protein [Rikenellaceae bacterium]
MVCLAVALMAGSLVIAQSHEQQILRWEHAVWDFGQIREVDGVVSHTFSATNTTDKPVVIERIYTSCGCTSTEYSTHPIGVGQKAQVVVKFDPAERPGEFEKRVTVVLNGSRREFITIRGNVEPRPRTVEDDYPYYMVKGLRFDNTTFGLGTVQHGTAQSTVIGYANTSEQTIRPKVRYKLRSGRLKVTLPERIAAGQRGQITLTYDLTTESRHYGQMVDKFVIEVDGHESSQAVYMAAIAIDNNSLANYDTAPTAEISERRCDFGVIPSNSGILRRQMTLKNLGDEELIVRYVEPKDEGFYITLQSETQIRGGESVTFEAVLDPEHYNTAEINDAVAIVTNDPVRPYRQIRVTAKREIK